MLVGGWKLSAGHIGESSPVVSKCGDDGAQSLLLAARDFQVVPERLLNPF